jgi:hypothetical protein
MVALQSRRADRIPLVAVWVLTLAVLAVGIAAVSPILIVWGVLGVVGVVFLTRVHLRDTRVRRSPDDPTVGNPAHPDSSVQPDAVGQEHMR